MKKPNILNNYKFRFYLLTLLGFIMVSIMLWGQYLRPRLPRDIPFQLTLFRLILLLFTCFIFCLVLKHLIVPKPSKFIMYIYPHLAPYHQLIFQPLYALDYIIRDTLFNVTKSVIRLLPYITFDNPRSTFLLYFFLNFIPRIFLLILFILDIFYFKKLELMYLFIWLGFIPLFIRYVKYILEQTKEDYILYLEPLYEGYPIPKNEEQKKEWADMYPNGGTNYRSYTRSITDLKCALLCIYNDYNYGGIPNLDILVKYYPDKKLYFDGDYDEIWRDIEKVGDIKREVGKRDFYDLMPLILILDVFLFNYNYVIETGNGLTAYEIKYNIKRRFLLKYWNIGIYSVYLISWVYILVISLPAFTLSNMDIIYLESFQDNLDPITNIIIDNENKPN
jgi:hypothetical protein